MFRCLKCRKVAAAAGLGCCVCSILFEFSLPAAAHSLHHLAVLTTNGRDDMAHAHEDEKTPPPSARLESAALSTAASTPVRSPVWSTVPPDVSSVPLWWTRSNLSLMQSGSERGDA